MKKLNLEPDLFDSTCSVLSIVYHVLGDRCHIHGRNIGKNYDPSFKGTYNLNVGSQCVLGQQPRQLQHHCKLVRNAPYLLNQKFWGLAQSSVFLQTL